MKRKFIYLSYLLVLIFTLVPLTAAEQDRDKLVYMTEDFPPFNFDKDGKTVGLSPDLLRLMWKKMNWDEQTIEILPWARGYKLAQIKNNHVLMSMTRTKEREKLFKWVGPIAKTEYVLIKLSKSDINIDSLSKAKKFTIGTVREDAAQQILASFDFDKNQIIKLNKIEQAIKMLYANRIDLIAYDKRSFFNILKIKKYPSNDFKALWLLSEENDHYAFHIDTPDSTIQKFQDALDSLKTEHKELQDYYFK